jgi:hypothetical protein
MVLQIANVGLCIICIRFVSISVFQNIFNDRVMSSANRSIRRSAGVYFSSVRFPFEKKKIKITVAHDK